ncbi:sulfite exporter TauE/SafE family protein [Sulfurimonas sp.]|nr:sulfite exporter TauE/SafE family protein [Sulfurimonas sp.]
MIELILLGISVGTLSGFFGIGGGTIIIPILLMLGYATKDAIGISVIQMVFSSVYGSYLNNKNGSLDIKMVSIIGFGGFLGALLSGFITSSVDDATLEIVFLVFALFALARVFFNPNENINKESVNIYALFIIGFIIGAVSMSVGVGGGLILIPILIGFLHVEMKKAVSAGLFFVVFSSIAGLISHGISRDIDFNSGVIIGFASLIGVYVGILLKDKVKTKLQKILLVGFYLLIVIYLINRIFING